jgi:hypothetical protein
MARKTKLEHIQPAPPEQLDKREQQLLDQGKFATKTTNGWQRRANPTWDKTDGRGPPKKDTPTRSQQYLRNMAAVQMANLARSAMAKFGYDGAGTGGAEGYMTMLAQRFPLQFMTDIIAKMIPQNVDATLTASVDITQRYESSEEARRDIGQMAVPLDLLLERGDPPLMELEAFDVPIRDSSSGNGQG